LDPALFEVRSGLLLDGERLAGASLYALAAQSPLGEALDHLVLQRALRRLARNRELRLIVNISLNSLVSSDFVAWLGGRLKPEISMQGRLLLQISEADALIAQHHLGPFSEGLRELAIPLGIRHFGCSEEPLSYLPLMRTDFIRLDRSRSADIGDNPQRRQALTTLCATLRGKSIGVIAALIEDAALLPRLWEAGIHRVQGNCLQPPASAPRYRFPRRRSEA
ncbi:MAG: EAL domain-containing protein, partial [Pseudohongiellaceae bacterium]